MRIVFMGTPEFALPSLQRLIESQHDVVAVVTAPDKPTGRGLRVRPTPVKQVATELGLPVLQPADLSDQQFISRLQGAGADLFCVVAFRILPKEVFAIPPAGTVNVHASLLPKYRGAAPIRWAIINGEGETGVTTIFIKEEVDAGDIILQESVQIGRDETAGELHDRLADLGGRLLVRTVDLIERGQAPRRLQTGEPTPAPKLTRDVQRVRWQESAETVRNLIRGLAPTPGAFSYLNGKMIKFYRTRVSQQSTSAAPGEVVAADAREGVLTVATGSGCVHLLELQPEGKRRMSAAEFLRGHSIEPGMRFE